MPQGCNLHIDKKDWEDIKTAREQARKTLKSAMNRPDQLFKILNDKQNKNHEIVKLALEKVMIGEKIPNHEKQKLAPALKTILNNHKTLPGMFERIPKYRGPGSSHMNQHFELTVTAKLCQSGESRQKLKSTTGMDISINKTDEISFGDKYASKYASQSKGGTIEGDINIKRNMLDAPHAIDTKYINGNVRRLHNEKEFSQKLTHVSRALRDGQIKSFTYVTNAVFSERTKEMIFEANCSLIVHHASKDQRLTKEINQILKTQDDDSGTTRVKPEKLINNKEVVNKFIETKGEKYELIGTVEKINFKP